MKRKRQKTTSRQRVAADPVVEEFERRDLGRDIETAGTRVTLRKHLKPRPTSILLDADLIQKLRDKGAKRGLGYQTMLKLIVNEQVDKY